LCSVFEKSSPIPATSLFGTRPGFFFALASASAAAFVFEAVVVEVAETDEVGLVVNEEGMEGRAWEGGGFGELDWEDCDEREGLVDEDRLGSATVEVEGELGLD
jgi:hypothetical protein